MVAIIIHRGRILLLKRRSVPFILNPGIWSFLSGGRKRGEPYLCTAYREIEEESGIKIGYLKLLHCGRATLADPRRMLRWSNRLYVFRSRTSKVRLDMENSAYRWATISEIRDHDRYTNVFIDENFILCIIGRFLYGSGKPAKKD